MGFWWDVSFSAELSPFGKELFQTYEDCCGDWKAVSDILWQHSARILEISQAMGNLDPFDLMSCRRGEKLIIEFWSKLRGGGRFKDLDRVLPYLVAEPADLSIDFEALDTKRVVRIEPKEP
jgi:hypothetical protein